MLKTYVANIKGKKYTYAYDSVFITKGKTKQVKKMIGRADDMSGAPADKLKDFVRFVTREEARLRFMYWEPKVTNTKFKKYVSIEKIESHRSLLFHAKQDMGNLATEAMEAAFSVDFIYNSNRLEGSKVPRKRVEQQVREPSKKLNEEVRNTLRALYYVDSHFKFNPSQIKKLHEVLLAHEPQKHGFRKEVITVGESDEIPFENIQEKLKELCEWYEKAKYSTYPPELAFDFYYKFERIHPFIDGNGRAGRLIMNRILKDHKYHPFIVWTRREKSHMTAFKKRVEGRAQDFYKFMYEQFIKTHQIYLDKIGKAFDLQSIYNSFFEPSDYNE